MKFSVFQLSNQGGRQKNEDRMGYCYTREAGLFVLADGMGGHPQGEVAAQATLQTCAALFQREAKPFVPDPAMFLSAAVMAAHHEIIRYASQRGLMETPRTTVVAGLIQAGRLHWVHCGDSRLYVVRGGRLLMRTRDHSYLEAQYSTGLTISNAANRNVLFTCLGSTVRPIFDAAGPLTLVPGDKILLCSDGLWSSVNDADIVRVLSGAPVEDAVPELVAMALNHAGAASDNVTVLALDWENPQEAAAGPGAPGSSLTETHAMADNVFASTIQPEPADELPPSDEFDEDAIERSIAEINEAIARTITKKP
ncbi:MAG: protein phosphatase 2C domain-containing protein [Burkholderiaceae bacterium]|jgi:serine/threonine protein phosphatase PrpC|nr:protein phosphatase 2C domain-containing protein [Burkholderiaceae bacterium]